MKASYNIAVIFGANTAKAVAAVTRLNSKLAMARKRFKSAADAAGKFGTWGLTRLTLPIAALGTAFAAAAGKMEQWRIGFETILKSAPKANAMLDKLIKFSDRTPFQAQTIVKGAPK